MSDSQDQVHDLNQHIVQHFDGNRPQWDRLKALVSEAHSVAADEAGAVTSLKKQRPFLRRAPRRELARFRRKYRKSYRKTADGMIKNWRPNYESRLAKARPYQQDISRITRHEIRNRQMVQGILKKIIMVCDDLRKKLKR